MLRILRLAGASVLVFMLVACGGEEESNDDVSKTYLIITPTMYTFSAAGGDYTLTVNCKSPWEVKSEESQDWLTFAIQKGIGYAAEKITAQTNTGTERTATLVFTSGEKTAKCTVTQLAHPDTEKVTPDSCDNIPPETAKKKENKR